MNMIDGLRVQFYLLHTGLVMISHVNFPPLAPLHCTPVSSRSNTIPRSCHKKYLCMQIWTKLIISCLFWRVHVSMMKSGAVMVGGVREQSTMEILELGVTTFDAFKQLHILNWINGAISSSNNFGIMLFDRNIQVLLQSLKCWFHDHKSVHYTE